MVTTKDIRAPYGFTTTAREDSEVVALDPRSAAFQRAYWSAVDATEIGENGAAEAREELLHLNLNAPVTACGLVGWHAARARGALAVALRDLETILEKTPPVIRVGEGVLVRVLVESDPDGDYLPTKSVGIVSKFLNGMALVEFTSGPGAGGSMWAGIHSLVAA